MMQTRSIAAGDYEWTEVQAEKIKECEARLTAKLAGFSSLMRKETTREVTMIQYFTSLNPAAFGNALPGNVAQGLIWGIMALGVYITFRLLDFADLTVDGSFATGGAVTVMMTIT